MAFCNCRFADLYILSAETSVTGFRIKDYGGRIMDFSQTKSMYNDWIFELYKRRLWLFRVSEATFPPFRSTFPRIRSVFPYQGLRDLWSCLAASLTSEAWSGFQQARGCKATSVPVPDSFCGTVDSLARNAGSEQTDHWGFLTRNNHLYIIGNSIFHIFIFYYPVL